jgi:DNA-binding XRE family transcriptional regulator
VTAPPAPTGVQSAATARAVPAPALDGPADQPVDNLGSRLKAVRVASGLSLREVARQLGVSPSFVSQLENGKSQPSVATLYSISQLLQVSIDELFSAEGTRLATAPASGSRPGHGTGDGRTPAGDAHAHHVDGHAHSVDPHGQISRSELGSPANAWPDEERLPRLSVTRPGERQRLEMDSGVVWERLAGNTGTALDFMEIIYPPHSASTNDQRMLQHAGSEFGYLVEGELEITVGFDVFTLRAGESIGFDSAMPHLLANRTDRPARGVWFVRHA